MFDPKRVAAGSEETTDVEPPLAIDIANAVSTANGPLDVEAKADELLKSHPEADASREDIRDTLKAERNARRTEDLGGRD